MRLIYIAKIINDTSLQKNFLNYFLNYFIPDEVFLLNDENDVANQILPAH